MVSRKARPVSYRRKKEGKTDYRKRLKLISSGKPRLVVRRSLTSILLQVVEYSPDGDRVIASAHSSDLKKIGWKAGIGNIPAAYLTGFLLGKKAAAKKINECIFDSGLVQPVKASRIYAAVKGVVDSGINVPFSDDVAPSEERIKGKHIAEFAKGAGAKQFSVSESGTIEKQFDDMISKIKGMKND